MKDEGLPAARQFRERRGDPHMPTTRFASSARSIYSWNVGMPNTSFCRDTTVDRRVNHAVTSYRGLGPARQAAECSLGCVQGDQSNCGARRTGRGRTPAAGPSAASPLPRSSPVTAEVTISSVVQPLPVTDRHSQCKQPTAVYTGLQAPSSRSACQEARQLDMQMRASTEHNKYSQQRARQLS
jgi:hypothetical protein